MFPASVCRFSNGLTFIHQQIPTTPVVVADVWVRAGAIVESEPWFGMAHFLEHMIFKGTATLPPGEFDYQIEKMGGVSNAATSYDYAHYSLITAAPYLIDTLPYLGELLLNAKIPEDEFICERDVVLEEIRASADDHDAIGFQSLLKNVYQGHPYGRSILGTEQELMQHSPEAMRCFHRAHYQPENMTIVVVGGIEQEAAWNLVNRSFADFADTCNFPVVNKIATPLIKGIKRHELILPRLEQGRLMMAWIGPGVDHIRTAHGLDLLSVLLGEGRTSRLVHDLREEKQLVQAICSNFVLQKESSLLTITAWLEPEYLERVEELIRGHLHNLQHQGVSEQEMNRCRRLMCNEYAFTTETPHQLTSLYGYYSTLAQPEVAGTYLEDLRSFESQELQNLAQKYLSPDNYVVTILKPC
ncbi:processing peptidase [Richelia sinica FACHB-800]|uniref:Processing peptidase n=1 Tax=Richelia sinica FACHB-800 TaxID=1357546 RepID=A0A975T8H1_9NOST|nr:pitrilysin family protein [Richelia sinica]MBD2667476.1 insulinase family protein [Richelia sinica FACHB-800]QXE23840.1 processing peptidase [Richelia sinica FACHB-800]